jgi:S-adenosylmethionine decarboxylase
VVSVGLHLLVDLHGSDPVRLKNVELVKTCLPGAAAKCGMTAMGPPVLHQFPGQGVTGVLVLKESHISVHTWPEHAFAALDIFTCGPADPRKAVDFIKQLLGASASRTVTVDRG